MGWKQSPPLFTAATETVADLANIKLELKHASVPHHPYLVPETAIEPDADIHDTIADPKFLPLPPLAPRRRPSKPIPVKSWEVYVDEFIRMVQGNHGHRQHVKQILLTSLDEVL
jgi:hypothetical protein